MARFEPKRSLLRRVFLYDSPTFFLTGQNMPHDLFFFYVQFTTRTNRSVVILAIWYICEQIKTILIELGFNFDSTINRLINPSLSDRANFSCTIVRRITYYLSLYKFQTKLDVTSFEIMSDY